MMHFDGDQYIVPDWPAPERVAAVVTCRAGGDSCAPYESFNLALHVGDDSGAVMVNRARLQSQLTSVHEPQWLEQVHGIEVVKAVAGGPVQTGDALITDQAKLPCAVLTADCLPVMFCDTQGTEVAVAHAGWRGLAAGVLEATLAKFRAPGSRIMAWLGPAIGPDHFEVGDEVRDCFVQDSVEAAQAFTVNESKAGHWFADLYRLARLRLERSGVTQIYGGGFCTYTDSARFYSYRRDGITGRMASLIWLQEVP